LFSVPTYRGSTVKQPLIKVEAAGKTSDGLSLANGTDTQRKAVAGLRVPRGVYRFKTHEEADEWMVKMLAQSGKQKP